ncbi:hypothetical protein CRE_04685 [Caenorhabditis remanei]|uniref:Uncharacterized protein n=1 Tax=Caenorhabditis remanei TaxID=31234 RepID=E3LYP9_CAERE|nr:hypothetical protein CRE_04685 [Caenorhabditis remanei]
MPQAIKLSGDTTYQVVAPSTLNLHSIFPGIPVQLHILIEDMINRSFEISLRIFIFLSLFFLLCRNDKKRKHRCCGAAKSTTFLSFGHSSPLFIHLLIHNLISFPRGNILRTRYANLADISKSALRREEREKDERQNVI